MLGPLGVVQLSILDTDKLSVTETELISDMDLEKGSYTIKLFKLK